MSNLIKVAKNNDKNKNMTKKDYKIIAESIWRSGYIKDKNKVKQQAKEKMRCLIANDLTSSLKADNPSFNKNIFLKACGI